MEIKLGLENGKEKRSTYPHFFTLPPRGSCEITELKGWREYLPQAKSLTVTLDPKNLVWESDENNHRVILRLEGKKKKEEKLKPLPKSFLSLEPFLGKELSP